MITRCPACETRFRITEAQLNTARGAVRCGSCLQIFKAAEHLVGDKAVATEPRPEPESTPPSAPAVAAEPAPEANSSSAAASEPEKSAFGDDVWRYDLDEDEVAGDVGQENMLRFDQEDIDGDEPEENFSDDLLISDEMSVNDTQEHSSVGALGDELNESFLDLDSWKSNEKSLFDRQVKPKTDIGQDELEDPDESWALELLREDEEDGEESAPAPAAEDSAEPAQSQPDLDFGHDSETDDPFADLEIVPGAEDSYSRSDTGSFDVVDDEHQDLPAPAERSLAWPESEEDEGYESDGPYVAESSAGNGRSDLLSRIEPEPVEFAAQQGRNWRRTLLWGGLSLLGAAVLVTQVAWLQFERLSRLQPYRDWYAVVCPVVGCELPSLAAPDKIRTSNLVVRSHPQASGALMVDTILLNTAAFPQPFPDLVLTFSNIHGETLASRRFTPAEYLAGELAGRSQMPSNQPVHLNLEVVDPGPDAVNYSAYIPH